MRNKKSGQVLFLGLIMLLVLFFAIFLFFDIHNVIRGKIKLETAEQSAALTAAAWQAKSLNLIGELNLLIATESVWSDTNIDIPDKEKEEAEKEREEAKKNNIILQYTRAEQRARIKTLNEMQSRITFIGPIIALTAAQQAAKHNGIDRIKPSTEKEKQTQKRETLNLADDFEEYFKRLEDPNNIYYASGNMEIKGYNWLMPYQELLKSMTSNGVAVRPNAMIMGLEGLNPSYLGDEGLYSAIHACNKGWPAWCHGTLRSLIKNGDAFFEGTHWYSPDFSMIQFSQQSEIYPLEVMLSDVNTLENPGNENEENYTALVYDDYKKQADEILKKRFPTVNLNIADRDKVIVMNAGNEPIVTFYSYNRRWFQGRYYTGPITPQTGDDESPWQSAGYYGVLRKDVADWALYGGAAAYAECVQNIPDTLPFKSKISEKDAFQISQGGKNMPLGDIVGTNERNNLIDINFDKDTARVGGNFTIDQKQTGCVAKPLGKLENDVVPTAIPIVLPVFHRASLIPSTMQAIHVFSYDWPLIEEFILGLRTMLDEGKDLSTDNNDLFKYEDSSGNKSGHIPVAAENMLEALRILKTKEFRRKGHNPDYNDSNTSARTLMRYFERDNHLYDPVVNPAGPGWLQQPVVRSIHGYRLPDEAKEEALYYYTKNIAEGLNRKIDPKKEQKYHVPKEGEIWVCYKGEYLKIIDGKLSDIMEKDSEKGCGPKRGGSGGGGHPGSAMGPDRL